MPIVWPATLPQLPEYGWRERKLPNTVDSETDAGPSKRRRRFTKAKRHLVMTFQLTAAQVATLETFHTDTLADASLNFEFPHPRTGVTHSCRWVNEFDVGEPSRNLYRVGVEFEYTV